MRQPIVSDISLSLDSLPVLGICGYSGVGKTTLIEAMLPILAQKGLTVAVVKYDAHNVVVDTPGKDSDRFFQAGGDVCLLGNDSFCHQHGRDTPESLFTALCQRYDLVLIEGHVKTPAPKIWLLGPEETKPPADLKDIRAVFTRQETCTGAVIRWIHEWLKKQWRLSPVWGCILIGGKSRRMGTPKHLLQENGRTWLEQSVETLGKQVDRVVISGNGELPKSLQHLDRIPDVPGVEGPLAGILSVMRWAPSVSWLIAACDMPRLQRDALEWLLDQRSPGVWAVLPDLHGAGRVEPLLAYYDFRSRLLLEEFAAQKQSKLNMLAENPRVRNSRPPVVLHESWKNINTLLDLERIT